MNTTKTPVLSTILLMIITCLIVNISYSQKTSLEFTSQEVFDDYKVVSFELNRIATEVEFKEIYNKVYDDPSILELTYDGKASCKAKLEHDVSPEYIQQYLVGSGFDFAFKNIKNNLLDLENLKTTLKFSEMKILDDQYKVVYFCLSELRDEDHKDQILVSLSNSSFVKNARIYQDLYGLDRVQLTILKDYYANDVLYILKENNTDFKYIIVKTNKTK